LAFFHYKNQEASGLVSNAVALAAYANQTYDGAAAAGDISIQVGRERGDSGWTVLSPEALGYSGIVDANGTYNGETNRFKDAQAEVFAQYDVNGNVTQVGLAIRGTGGPEEDQTADTIGDVLDYLEFLKSEPQYVEGAFGNLLASIKDFLTTNGLTAQDMIVTGHSLGGGAVTNMAERSDAFLDGFFVDANYIGFASHYTAEDGSSVLGSGAEVFSVDFENDPVPAVITDGKVNVFGNDTNYGYETSNLVFYNDLYGTPAFWDGGNVINPLAWSTHSSANYANAVAAISESTFYTDMGRDSLIVVSGLSDGKRDDKWVEDEFIPFDNTGHFGDGAFILGSEGNDWLRGNRGDDALDGFAGNDNLTAGKGNDRICDGTGADVMTGGAGADIFILVADTARDTITDFKRGEDKIDLSHAGVTSFDELGFEDQGWFKTFDILYADDVVSLEKSLFSNYAELSANDFLFA